MRIVIAVSEKALRLLKAAEVEYQELWRDGAERATAAPSGKPAERPKSRIWELGKGGFVKVVKLPAEGDKGQEARAARITAAYLKEQSLSQVDKTFLARHIAEKMGWKTAAYCLIRRAWEKGYITVVS